MIFSFDVSFLFFFFWKFLLLFPLSFVVDLFYILFLENIRKRKSRLTDPFVYVLDSEI